MTKRVDELMTKDDLVTVPVGTTLEQAREILKRHKVEKLLVVDDAFMLRGLITIKDITKAIAYPHSAKDDLGRLRVAAAVGSRATSRRAPRPSSRPASTPSSSTARTGTPRASSMP
jgi:IMP dehydrogenase